MTRITAEPLSPEGFADYGQVIDCSGAPDKIINDGRCGRYHDRAALDFVGGRAGVSLFRSDPVALPYSFDLVERHPDGSQAFLPMTEHPFLVIVAPDLGGHPGRPRAFLTTPGQGINFFRSTWHGVLTPLHEPGLFAVVDRIGIGENLEEFRYPDRFTIDPPP
ncbi:MAG: ureidoglycolate lyase [Marinibacterium sp.]|nr:ureidoglycolate lyase [Marinibacterium sp.]